MKIVDQSYEIITPIDACEIMKKIEKIARTCYKSENNITDDSASKLISRLIKNGHEAMIEHHSITVKFICDRGISHEIVRHRIGSYAQESTRYCAYDKDNFENQITVIRPSFINESKSFELNNLWELACREAEKTYFSLREIGAAAQEARAVLPTSLKTEIVCTYNLRQWKKFFELRTASNAHPDIRKLVTPLLEVFQSHLPEIFGNISSASKA